jgi:deazaflavin-dependent oxidoreductase (nitroreductase family)
MPAGTARQHGPRGLLRGFMRMPIWLYRLRLGRLMGDRFLLLVHIGRKSRQLRYVVLEVLRADPATGTYIIASGWGRQSDWFRNIQQTPHVLVDTGRQRFEATPVVLSAAEATAELLRYAEQHPVAFRNLARIMLGRPVAGDEDDCRQLAQAVPLVALQRR